MRLSQDRLRQLISYDPATGLFTCITPRRNRAIGDIENKIGGPGYVCFCIDGKQYYAHRLAWLYVHGRWPPSEIDHANGDRTDNRLANLRIADRSQQNANTRTRSDNKIGLKGVFPNKKRWSAQIISRGKQYHLGTFDTPEQAHAVYYAAARELYGQFARGA